MDYSGLMDSHLLPPIPTTTKMKWGRIIFAITTLLIWLVVLYNQITLGYSLGEIIGAIFINLILYKIMKRFLK